MVRDSFLACPHGLPNTPSPSRIESVRPPPTFAFNGNMISSPSQMRGPTHPLFLIRFQNRPAPLWGVFSCERAPSVWPPDFPVSAPRDRRVRSKTAFPGTGVDRGVSLTYRERQLEHLVGSGLRNGRARTAFPLPAPLRVAAKETIPDRSIFRIPASAPLTAFPCHTGLGPACGSAASKRRGGILISHCTGIKTGPSCIKHPHHWLIGFERARVDRVRGRQDVDVLGGHMPLLHLRRHCPRALLTFAMEGYFSSSNRGPSARIAASQH